MLVAMHNKMSSITHHVHTKMSPVLSSINRKGMSNKRPRKDEDLSKVRPSAYDRRRILVHTCVYIYYLYIRVLIIYGSYYRWAHILHTAIYIMIHKGRLDATPKDHRPKQRYADFVLFLPMPIVETLMHDTNSSSGQVRVEWQATSERRNVVPPGQI